MIDSNDDNASETPHRSGYVAIVGRPNVGKSSLLNQILGQKVAIVTPKPQTTRTRILGVHTVPGAQIVFFDTPGLHKPRSILNRRFVDAATEAIEEADVLLWLVDVSEGITAADRAVWSDIRDRRKPTVVVANKMDRIARASVLPMLTALAELAPNSEIVPTSALNRENLDELIDIIVKLLPAGPPFYDEDTLTDQTERMLAQEAVREQVLLQIGQEIPYGVAVTMDRYEEKGNLVVMSATLHVERESQKRILVGRRGSRIRELGTAARLEIEKILDRKVYLELFVRVQEEWTTNPSLIREFGL